MNRKVNSFNSDYCDFINSETYYSENPIKIKDVAIAGLIVSGICYALTPLIAKKDCILNLKNKLVKVVKKNNYFDKTV